MPYFRRQHAPDVAQEQLLWTYQDLVDFLVDRLQLRSDGRGLRMARQAAAEAISDLANWHEWKIYRRLAVISSVASASGTATYTHATRQLVISAGTWPSWAAFGQVKLNSVVFDVEERKADNITLVLPERSNPGADVVAGGFSIFRTRYPLPLDFHRVISELFEVPNQLALDDLGLATLYNDLLSGQGVPSQSQIYAIVDDPRYLGNLSIQFQVPPSSARSYAFVYERVPRPLVTERHSKGTIDFLAAASTATGTGTSFTAAHKGCVLRVGTATDEPTRPAGYSDGKQVPPAYQRVVLDVNVGTQVLTLDESLAAAGAALKYTLSDPIDLEYAVMLSPLLRLAEWKLTLLIGGKTDEAKRESDFRRALDLAQNSDRRTNTIMSAGAGEEDLFWLGVGEVTNE